MTKMFFKMYTSKLMCVCVSVLFLLFGLCMSQSVGVTTTEEPELSDVICQTCNCSAGVIDCANREISQPFELLDWEGIVDLAPTTVDLSQNPLTSVTRISSLPIQTLNISNCKVTTLEEAAFIYLTDLVTLDLSRNLIASNKLNRKVFVGPMTSNMSPVSFDKIRYLSLAHNELHSLPQDVFTFMTSITTLDLSGNPLAYIDQVTMAAITDLVNLRELYLSSCELESLPEGIFRRQRRLRRLDLSDNRFTTVPAVLSEASNLVYLNIGKNPVRTLDTNNAIRNLTNLQELRFCRNSKLANISAGALAGLPNLVSLHICHNPRLSIIHPAFLAFTDDQDNEVWPVLTELYLNDNNLSEIDSSFLHRWDQLTVVDVSSNPFNCDCKNQWLVDVLVPMILRLGRPDLAGNMICKNPKELRGLSFVLLNNATRTLSCPESVSIAEMPVPDMAILLGIMIGIFVTFPLVLVLVLLWRKGYFSRAKRETDEFDEETDAF